MTFSVKQLIHRAVEDRGEEGTSRARHSCDSRKLSNRQLRVAGNEQSRDHRDKEEMSEIVENENQFEPLHLEPHEKYPKFLCEEGSLNGVAQTTDLASTFTLHTPVPKLYLIKDFISHSNAEVILRNTRHRSSMNRSVRLTGRTTQTWGGRVDPDGLACAEALPPFLQTLANAFVSLGIFPPDKTPNHVLINQYEIGCGILPHKDGPAYHPIVAILNLGSTVVFDFWRSLSETNSCGSDISVSPGPIFSLFLKPTDVLVFQDKCYTELLHGISDRWEDDLHRTTPQLFGIPSELKGCTVRRDFRTSLTLRFVPPKQRNLSLA